MKVSNIVILIIFIMVYNNSFGQVNDKDAPLDLFISQVGSSSPPKFEITLTNISDKSVPVLKPDASGKLSNLTFIIISATGDTTMVKLDEQFARPLGSTDIPKTISLKTDVSIQFEVELFGGLAGLPSGGYSVQAVYRSFFRSASNRGNQLAHIYPEDIASNILIFL